MKLPRLGIFAAVMLGTSLAGVNAAIKDLPIREVNGRTYHYYEVASKETVYSLCHKLGISKEELVKYNPAVADGLKSGTVLFFPVDEPETPAANPVPQGKTMITHNVEKGQTIYGIATKYGISTQELIDQNPIVSEGLKAGQVLHISVPAANVAPAPVCLDRCRHCRISAADRSGRARDLRLHREEEGNFIFHSQCPRHNCETA